MKKYFSIPFYKKSPIIVTTMLLSGALFLAACSNNKNADNSGDEKNNSIETSKPADNSNKGLSGDSSLLTIYSINEDAGNNKIEIRFYERAAIYSIGKSDKTYMEYTSLLADAVKSNVPMKFVISGTTNSILRIDKASDTELRDYNTGDGINSPKNKITGVAPVKIDWAKIDTSIFNRVENLYKFPVFRLCNNIVPDYATLVAIFNDCANQGCNKPQPYTITNCIPFQYVRDGCYARAHKMRQMIMNKYGYCVEKVFSFAEGYPNKLAVKANMWGGCCVEWWYHVVPLLRINMRFGKRTFQVCYVIDPGMFTTPVTLSTWLQAQRNTTCNPNANVTSYSIQPGTAYWPLGSSSSFGTDPNYVNTEQTLISYKNLVTCN